MVNPRINTSKTHFRQHECKNQNTLNYLASILKLDNNVERRVDDSTSTPTIPDSQQHQEFATAFNMTSYSQFLINPGQLTLHHNDNLPHIWIRRDTNCPFIWSFEYLTFSISSNSWKFKSKVKI